MAYMRLSHKNHKSLIFRIAVPICACFFRATSSNLSLSTLNKSSISRKSTTSLRPKSSNTLDRYSKNKNFNTKNFYFNLRRSIINCLRPVEVNVSIFNVCSIHKRIVAKAIESSQQDVKSLYNSTNKKAVSAIPVGLKCETR